MMVAFRCQMITEMRYAFFDKLPHHTPVYFLMSEVLLLLRFLCPSRC